MTGDQVVFELTWRGTHTGSLQTPEGEIPPTGKSMEMRACNIAEIEGGKTKSIRQYFEMLTYVEGIWPRVSKTSL